MTPARRRARAGFTLIEVMIVITLVAVGAGVVSLSLRDARANRLEREGLRLALLLETARAEARAAALSVRWMPTPEVPDQAFRFVGLPPSNRLPRQWLEPGIVARVEGGALALGPEPLIGAQQVELVLDGRRVQVFTDGLQPFAVREVPADAP